MYSTALSLPFILPVVFTVMPIPRTDLGLSALDDDPSTFLASDEQMFEIISPPESFDSDTDLFSTNACSDTAETFDPFWNDSLQARGNTCSAGDEKANNSGEGASSPSSEKMDSDNYDTRFQTEFDPLKRVFSLPKDYQDERCKEYDFIRYAVCSSGDYRDEAKSMAYSFFPIQAYRLRQCTFMFSEFGICFNPGKIWCCVVYSEIGGLRIADGCIEINALPGGLGGSLLHSPLL